MHGNDHRIDAATWSRVSPLLDAALDLPPAVRAAWLATLPPQHADLKALLRELLERAAEGETITLLKALPALHTLDAAATDALVCVRGRARKLTFHPQAWRAKVSCQRSPATHADGHQRAFPTGSFRAPCRPQCSS